MSGRQKEEIKVFPNNQPSKFTSKEASDALRFAMQVEKDGFQFYTEAKQKASHPLGRKMFECLAVDEEKHLEILKQASQGRVHQEVTQKSDIEMEKKSRERLKSIFSSVSTTLAELPTAGTDDVQAIRVGLKLEDTALAFYREASGKSSDAAAKAVYDFLIKEETQHREILENTLEFFSRPSDWFMEKEGWIFDGG